MTIVAPTPTRVVHGARWQTLAPDATGLAARLHGYLKNHGGFTVQLPSGDPVSDGVSVCADPGSTLRFPAAEWDTRRVARWLRQCEHRVTNDAIHLGGWLDRCTNHIVLDLVIVFPDHLRDHAVAHGRHHRQRAAFDLTNDELIPLREPRPSGETPR